MEEPITEIRIVKYGNLYTISYFTGTPGLGDARMIKLKRIPSKSGMLNEINIDLIDDF